MSQSQLQSSRLEDEFQTKFTQLTNKVTSDGKNRRGSSQTAGDIMVSVMDESDYFDDENDEEGYIVVTPQRLEEALENLTTVFFLLNISFITKITQYSPHLPQFSPRLVCWVKWRI